jgi:hypothetical protein
MLEEIDSALREGKKPRCSISRDKKICASYRERSRLSDVFILAALVRFEVFFWFVAGAIRLCLARSNFGS